MLPTFSLHLGSMGNLRPPRQGDAKGTTRPNTHPRRLAHAHTHAAAAGTAAVRGWQNLRHPPARTHLVIGLDGAQPHGELEAQEVVGAHGLQLQQLAQRHQLRPRQVVQRQLVLEQLGETQDLLVAGSLPRLSNLREQ